MRSLVNFLSKNDKWIILFSMALFGAIHARFLTLPPIGHHVWRQAFTSSVAWNFFEENLNIFKPRVSNRGVLDGVTGMQFPLYEWICALWFKVFGFNESFFRWFSMALTLGAVGFFWRYATRQVGTVPGLIGALMLLWSPEIYYHGINALPDIMALFFAMIALDQFDTYCRNEKKIRTVVIAYGALVLAGLVKLQFLMFGALWITPYLKHLVDPFQKNKLIVHGMLSSFTIGIVLGWYGYADHLRTISDLKDVGLYTTPSPGIKAFLKNTFDVLVVDFPETLFGFSSIVVLIIGLGLFVVKVRPTIFAWIGWGITLMVYGIFFVLESGQFKLHSYYLIPFIVLLIVPCIHGIAKADPRLVGILSVFVLIQPFFSSIRIDHRWQKPATSLQPLELYQPELRSTIIQLIPDDGNTLVGPDPSGCIYFYLTQTYGTCGYDEKHFFQKWNDRDSLQIEYAITKFDLPEESSDLLLEQDGFKVYRISEYR